MIIKVIDADHNYSLSSTVKCFLECEWVYPVPEIGAMISFCGMRKTFLVVGVDYLIHEDNGQLSRIVIRVRAAL